MNSDDLKRIEMKVNLMLKAFLSFYGYDDEWDRPFDDMKDFVQDDLTKLLELDPKDPVRQAYLESLSNIPFISKYGGRAWWIAGMREVLLHSAMRIKVLNDMSDQSSMWKHSFPEALRPELKKLMREGSIKEIQSLLHLYANGCDFAGKEPLIDNDDWIALIKDKRENVRLAAAQAIVERLDDRDYYLDDGLASTLLVFFDDISEKVLAAIAPILPRIVNVRGVDFESLLKSKNDSIRYRAVCIYLGYNPEMNAWSSGRRPDLKEVARLVSDPFEPISKLAEAYLDRKQSPRW
jgi:hypothetical protein